MLNMISPEMRARIPQHAANAISVLRGVTALALSTRIWRQEDHRSITNSVVSVATDAGDKLDGFLSAKSKDKCKPLGIAHRPQPRLDEMLDKLWNHSTFLAIGLKELRNEDPIRRWRGAGFLACELVNFGRDLVVTRQRNAADALNQRLEAVVPSDELPSEDRMRTNALFSGKVKQLGFAATRALELSPAASTPPGETNAVQIASLGLMAASTALAVYSGAEQVQSLHEQRADFQTRYQNYLIQNPASF